MTVTYLTDLYRDLPAPKPTIAADRNGLSSTKVPWVTVELEGMERRVERRQEMAHLVINILHTSRPFGLTSALAIREAVLERMPQTAHANGVYALDVVEDIGLTDLTELETTYTRHMFSVQLFLTQN
ncbi:hypothetical protein [Nonomuraea gerenzanensis]|uniref:hypothetical protein n=1 Tax=Nonomuraea gerenzanensis TaxID=93944 RepID=UPI001CD9336B|nr:hypothetical protein [Nonomuraea gerenzanensis]UBU12914.1 hypothetical protein LCN96_53185 [Nonomuraea gerenzanensis]